MQIVSLPSSTRLYRLRIEGVSDLVVRYLTAYQIPKARPAPQPDSPPSYSVPSVLDDKSEQMYRKALDQIVSTHAHAVRMLTEALTAETGRAKERETVADQAASVAQLLVPIATQVNIEIELTPRDVPVLFAELAASHLSEAATLQVMITEQVDQDLVPQTALASTEQQDTADMTVDLPPYSIDHTEPVRLLTTTFRNELDLLPYILYEQTGLSFAELSQEISSWPIGKKIDRFETYLRQQGAMPEARALHPLDHQRYNWDIVTDYLSFSHLQTLLPSTSLLWQPLTARYGFSIPETVESAGLSDVYETCYDLSLQLYSALVEQGYAHEAQYALLSGHKLRVMAAHTAREATTMLAGRDEVPVLQQLHTRLSEVHPILAESMTASTEL